MLLAQLSHSLRNIRLPRLEAKFAVRTKRLVGCTLRSGSRSPSRRRRETITLAYSSSLVSCSPSLSYLVLYCPVRPLPAGTTSAMESCLRPLIFRIFRDVILFLPLVLLVFEGNLGASLSSWAIPLRQFVHPPSCLPDPRCCFLSPVPEVSCEVMPHIRHFLGGSITIA